LLEEPFVTPEQATLAWIATMGPEATARSNSYFEGGYLLLLAGWAVTVASCALLIWLKLLPNLRDRLEGRVKNGFFMGVILTIVATIALSILSFPLDLYAGFYREHQFGLATQTLPEWLGEFAIGFAINLIISALAISGLYQIVKRAPNTWWIWGAGATGAFMALMIAIAPVFIAPLFNTYTPMEDGPLKADILAMAQANGVPAEDVFVFDESRQSNRVTANVSGLFGTTRIALADNLLTRVSPEGVRMVMAHEIGHYALGHVVSLLFFTLFAMAVIFGLLGVILKRLVGDGRWGIRAVWDPAGLPLVIAVAGTLFTLATPVFNNITRFHEHQADIFGINASREPAGFAETALLLAEYRKMQPGPLERALFYTHPSGWDRIHMAMTWQANEMAAGRLPAAPLGPPEGYRPDYVVTGEAAE
jgi:STE24 endopeptidase